MEFNNKKKRFPKTNEHLKEMDFRLWPGVKGHPWEFSDGKATEEEEQSGGDREMRLPHLALHYLLMLQER